MEAEFAGEFETHLTVRLGTATGAMDASARLEHRAARMGLKLTRIVLDRGAMPDQPVLTETGRGTLTERQAATLLRSAELRAAGFPVIRVKIEASPWNADIPQTADEAAALSPPVTSNTTSSCCCRGSRRWPRRGPWPSGTARTSRAMPAVRRGVGATSGSSPSIGGGAGGRHRRHAARPADRRPLARRAAERAHATVGYSASDQPVPTATPPPAETLGISALLSRSQQSL
ncbi:hypothetical protein [Streptomyces sp. NPDC002346]